MILNKTCKTCEFYDGKVCGIYKTDKKEVCEDWGASLDYYNEITKTAPWYIRIPHERYEIQYEQFMELLQKDAEGIPIEINIYDAIEEIYKLNDIELAGVLDVSVGVIQYAKRRKTVAKRKKQFSSKLHIPESFFDRFLSTQLNILEECKKEFQSFYGDKMIEKFKQNGFDMLEEKTKKQIAIDKIQNIKYREENQERYQYNGKNEMYHDLSDDYKSRDYVIGIILKEGNYYGCIFYEYMSTGYGLSITVMQDILRFIEKLDCETINYINEVGFLNNNIKLRADADGQNIHFELKNDANEKLQKTIPDKELQKYIIGYEMIRCDGHGMKKERRKCNSCANFTPIEGCAKGNCTVRGNIVQRSRIICAYDYVQRQV